MGLDIGRHPPGEVANSWDDLGARVDASPWLRREWFEAWVEAFGGRARLEVLAMHREGRMVAAAPLLVGWGALRSPTNYHTPSYELVAEEEPDRKLLAHALFAIPKRSITLRFVPEDTYDLSAFLEASSSAGRRTSSRLVERCPVIHPRGGEEGWEAHEAGLRGKMVRELRRRRRKLEEEGEVRFEVHSPGEGEVAPLLEQALEVEASGWKGDRGTAVLSDPATSRFYRRMATWAASRGWLRLAFLRVDDRPVAFDLALEQGGVHSLLKTGYRPDLRRFAPGMLLRREMVRRAFLEGLRRYDFLGHDSDWKREWTEETRPQLLVRSFSRRPDGAAAWAADAYGRPLLRRVLRR